MNGRVEAALEKCNRLWEKRARWFPRDSHLQ